MVDSVTDDTVTLSWMKPDPPNGIIIDYEIRHTCCGEILPYHMLSGITAHTFTIGRLAANTELCYRVRAETRIGIGNFSDKVMA